MSNLALLMKINILNLIGYNKFKNNDTKERKKAIAMALLIVFSMVVLSIYGFGLCLYISDFLIKINQMELLLILGIVIGSFATLFTSLYKASSYLFQIKDYEILASLPIKQSTILTSKILTLILNNYLFAGAFILIPGIVYFIKVDTSLIYILFLIILTLAVPIIPIAISTMIAFLISNISLKSKNTNLASIILNIALVFIAMLVSFNSQNIVINLTQNSSSIIEVTKKLYPPAYYFVDALKNINIVSLLIFLLVSIIPAILLIVALSNNFNKINSKLSETYKVNNYKFKELKTSKTLIALLKKEIKRYVSSTIYVMNSSIGMVLLLIFSISIVVVGYDKIAQLLDISVVVEMIKVQIIGVIVFCIIMTNTTCVSISLEGKNLWILKSSPIEEIEIFKSKILLNILLTIPISVISFSIISMKLNFGVNTTIVVLISIVLLSIFSSTLGLLINLMYPKFDFTSDVQVVKQSASVIITMISNIAYVAILCGIGYILKVNNIEVFLVISNIIVFASIVVLYSILKSKGVRLFKNLS